MSDSDSAPVEPRPSSTIPATLRAAGGIVSAQGLAGLSVAVVYLILALVGHHHESWVSGPGTALWFICIFGGVLAGGIALYHGRRWGRAIGVITNILLIPVAWSLLTGSSLLVDHHQALFGAPLMIIVLVVLGLVFAPVSVHYLAGHDLPPDA
ncbi:hypothetical protein MYK68_16555 [Gordonia sp. PP30]|uniref:hypothetical protein n=1 Tax=unclassified Gordonia (in: high G+C Gram-positive bacteria) TaxID=2657482 RepID=UPI001FFF17C9|nr:MULTISPECIES: hypothetical protein [unclassified Gordonia (in: high G+C Gram-positive bacteria)]UQE74315.1 hypothetical protein MYK68_16555 [Gordonia sp. PP30]